MHQDYILRMVQQYGAFLARVLRLRRDGEPEQALELITEAYGKLSGLPASLVHALSEEDLLSLLRTQGQLIPDRCLGLAELLREEAQTYDALRQPAESYPRYLKALRLYLEVVAADDEIAGDRLPGLDTTIEALAGLDLPETTADLLVRHLEAEGRFDEAEDVLRHRLDVTPQDDELRATVESFYRRLLTKPDAELIVGGLTRDEVAEALRELHTTPSIDEGDA